MPDHFDLRIHNWQHSVHVATFNIITKLSYVLVYYAHTVDNLHC